VLDDPYLTSMGAFQSYIPSVPHHMSNTARALDDAANAVSPGGKLFTALCNDQDLIS
jgi:hypothetical protein